MGTHDLTEAERLKFRLLAEGLAVSVGARDHIGEVNRHRPMTPADYASTSGLILRLPDDVWVNAPVQEHNPNFVVAPSIELVSVDSRLLLRYAGGEIPVSVWLPPDYHGRSSPEGEPWNSFAYTHGDRVRVAPIEGCAMTCRFCDLPYEFRYRTKPAERLLQAARVALADSFQPARHVLISGGAPRGADMGYLRDVYETVVSGLPGIDVDVMMVPIDDLMDPDWLAGIGVAEVSINIEVFNRDIARSLMRRKADMGLATYLDHLERSVERFGSARVRSMLMVGVEPMRDTLAGVDAVARRGATPVLSPFRADPSTPLRDHAIPTAALLEEAFLRATEIAQGHGVVLGPNCVPCTHNTLTLAARAIGPGSAVRHHGHPNLV